MFQPGAKSMPVLACTSPRPSCMSPWYGLTTARPGSHMPQHMGTHLMVCLVSHLSVRHSKVKVRISTVYTKDVQRHHELQSTCAVLFNIRCSGKQQSVRLHACKPLFTEERFPITQPLSPMQTIVTPKLETSRQKQPRTQMITNLNFSYQKCGAGRKQALSHIAP